MTFQLDTSGFVQDWVPPHGERAGYAGPNRVGWTDLDPFTQGYVEAALTGVETDEIVPVGYRPAGFSDLAPETLARIIENCAKAQTYRQHQAGFTPAARHGRFFWADRQRNCQGGFPPLTVSLGDDGKVYLR